MKSAYVLAVLSVLGAVTYAQQQAPKRRVAEAAIIFSGNQLQNLCSYSKSEEPNVASAACTMYILGVTDTLLMNDDTETTMKKPCPGKYVTRQQISDVVVKWLNDHPEKRDLPAPFIVMTALNEAFPCG